jgi:hypothetical protein
METKKFLSLFVLAAFVFFDSSCLTPRSPGGFKKTVKKDVAAVNQNDTKLQIVNVITTDGRNIPFNAKDPAHFLVDGSAVQGVTMREFAVEKMDIKSARRDKSGRILEIETSDGRTYKTVSATEEADRVLIRANAPILIPYGDIQQVWIRKSDSTANVIVALLVVGGAVGATVAIVDGLKNTDLGPEWESCPFVYSYDGEKYILDAEPYGMAITEGLKRVDWVELSKLREDNGKYRVLLANELDETQYTDELKLVVVDHAPGVEIAPDITGRIHTFPQHLAPTKAVDQKGRDILPFVAADDLVFWVSRLAEKTPDDPVMRDELVFEFPKPAGARRAKLLANVWTTQWASRSARLVLELYGTSLPEAYADVDRHGRTYGKVLQWMANEEIATLKVWVETAAGWQVRNMIYGGAPVITKDRAYLLDVADAPGETLRIKLRPPVNCWMVNFLAVDYAEDEPFDTVEIAAETALGPDGEDVRGMLAATDRAYLEAPRQGEMTMLTFAAPPVRPDRERTVFVKASGYYRIHIDARGEPQTELIERVFQEPDFAARMAFLDYRDWEAAVLAKRGRTPRDQQK